MAYFRNAKKTHVDFFIFILCYFIFPDCKDTNLNAALRLWQDHILLTFGKNILFCNVCHCCFQTVKGTEYLIMLKILKSTYNSSAKGIILEHIHIFCDKTGLSIWKSKKMILEAWIVMIYTIPALLICFCHFMNSWDDGVPRYLCLIWCSTSTYACSILL